MNDGAIKDMTSPSISASVDPESPSSAFFFSNEIYTFTLLTKSGNQPLPESSPETENHRKHTPGSLEQNPEGVCGLKASDATWTNNHRHEFEPPKKSPVMSDVRE